MRKLVGTLCLSVATISIPGCAMNSLWPSKPVDNSASSIPLANVPNPTQPKTPSMWEKAWDAITPKRTPIDSDPGKKIEATPYEGNFAAARLSERKGEHGIAEKMYRQMQKKYGETPQVSHRLGVITGLQNRLDESERHLAAAYHADPDNVDYVNDLAYNLFLQARLGEAEKLFRHALQIDPTSDRAVNNLALTVGLQGRTDESLDLFRRKNEEAEALANVAYIHAQNRDLNKAESAYHLALERDSSLKRAAEGLVQVDRAQKMVRLAQIRQQQTEPALAQSEALQKEAAELQTSLATTKPRNFKVSPAQPKRQPVAPSAQPAQALPTQQLAAEATSKAVHPSVVQPKPELVDPIGSKLATSGKLNTTVPTPDQIRIAATPSANDLPSITNRAVTWQPQIDHVVKQAPINHRMPPAMSGAKSAVPAAFTESIPSSPSYSMPEPPGAAPKVKQALGTSPAKVRFSSD